jgi:DNA-binding beta-propeller fold protein YncE
LIGCGTPAGARRGLARGATPGLGTVAVLSTSTLKLLYSVPVGTEPLGLAIDYDGQTAYVTNYGDGTVSYFTVPS